MIKTEKKMKTCNVTLSVFKLIPNNICFNIYTILIFKKEGFYHPSSKFSSELLYLEYVRPLNASS